MTEDKQTFGDGRGGVVVSAVLVNVTGAAVVTYSSHPGGSLGVQSRIGRVLCVRLPGPCVCVRLVYSPVSSFLVLP